MTMITDNAVYCMDALELLAGLGDASVDAIITDMPYGTTQLAWDSVIDLPSWWAVVKRVLKPRGVMVTTASQPFTSVLVCSNLDWFKYSWVWVKTKPSDHINAKNKPMRKHEDILVFSSGTTANCSPEQMYYYPQGLKPYNKVKYRPGGTINTQVIGTRPSHVNTYMQELTNYPDTVLMFPNGNNHNVHPTQKPLPLYEYLIRTYTQPGDLVVDPFCGSGTTLVAARNLGRRYIGGDITPEYVKITQDRLALPFTVPMFD